MAAGATSAAAASQANQQTYSPPPVTASSGGRQNSARSASVSSSSSLNVTLALIQRWILAEVGLASQRQLQQQPMLNTVSPVQVRAADGAAQSADTPPVVTADAAPASSSGAPIVSSQPNGSKNQDPGIPVDPSAVAKPGEEGQCCAIACTPPDNTACSCHGYEALFVSPHLSAATAKRSALACVLTPPRLQQISLFAQPTTAAAPPGAAPQHHRSPHSSRCLFMLLSEQTRSLASRSNAL